MNRFGHFRPSPAMLVALLALFVALGGVGYAAATIGSGDIINNSIKSKDIKNRTIRGKDVRRNGLGGGVIKESSLGQVPDAAHADSADNATHANNATNSTNSDQLGGVAASSYLHNVRTVTVNGISNSNTPKTVNAFCNPGEMAIGGAASINGLLAEPENVAVTRTVIFQQTGPATPGGLTAIGAEVNTDLDNWGVHVRVI